MSYITHIATALPEYQITAEDTERFFSFATDSSTAFRRKLRFLNSRTGILHRYSCIPDYKGERYELYKGESYLQPLETRMSVYREKVIPLAGAAMDGIISKSGVKPGEVTHLITVSCTGMMAPGLELLIAERYGLLHTEKLAINFLGCYAGLKALKHASYIAKADPKACVLVLCAELCSLHYYPSNSNEDLLAYLLFGDGAAATLVCGAEHRFVKEGASLSIGDCGTAFIGGTGSLMTWDLSSTAFRMFLSTEVVQAFRENIRSAVAALLPAGSGSVKHWAIHPGGVKIVEAVQEQLNLAPEDVRDSLDILKQYGNMSSATIVFILEKILNKIKSGNCNGDSVFACAFGPGLNMEMMKLTAALGEGEAPQSASKNERQIVPERTAG